jgi:apolipoprotein N-acyltransferase
VPFWLVCEYLRGTLLTGFPWLTLGYSQIDASLAIFAPIVGENGISALLLIVVVSLTHIINSNKQGLHALVIALIALLALLLNNISWVTPTGEKARIILVQGNIKQEMKWAPELEWPTMLKYMDLTRQHYPAEIIIWPESAITAVEAGNNAQEFLAIADKSAALNNSAIITGIINYNFETKSYYNSLVVAGKKMPESNEGHYSYNHSNRYYKNHLLPIGEFVPFSDWLKPLAPLFNLPMSSFSRGDYVQPNLLANGYNILPLICFEVAFANQLSANLTPATDILLTVSNDAWFGNSHGPHQHLDIVRMRALEFGRPFLRATNNGITATIDHHGIVTHRLPQFEEAVLKAEVTLVTGMTPYAKWTRLIDWAMPLMLFMLCAIRQYSLRTRS